MSSSFVQYALVKTLLSVCLVVVSRASLHSVLNPFTLVSTQSQQLANYFQSVLKSKDSLFQQDLKSVYHALQLDLLSTLDRESRVSRGRVSFL